MRLLIAAWTGVLMVAASAGVVAAVQPGGQFHAAPLEAEQEVQTPAVVSNATGMAQFRLSDDGQSVEYRLNVANIDEVVVAHIHIGAPGSNGPPVVFLFGPVSPTDRVQGVLASGVFTAAELVGPLAGQPLSALIDAMEAGNAYVNVHTSAYPNGEIRGQVD